MFTPAILRTSDTLKYSSVCININLLIVHGNFYVKMQREREKQIHREPKKREIYIEPTVTLELSVPQHVLHTVYRRGQRPKERLQRLHWEVTLTHTHQNKLKYSSHIHTAVCWSPGEWGNHKVSQPLLEHSEKPRSCFAPERRSAFNFRFKWM